MTVQATITFHIADPVLAAGHVDFSIHPESGRWRGTPLEQLAGLLTETAQQHVLDFLVRTPLANVLASGVGVARERMAGGLSGDLRLAETGLEVIGVRVVAIRPAPEVEKALQTPAREQVQQQADRATYERRALAVESERAIGENELQSQIELARREEQLVAQRGANARRQAEEAAAANGIEMEAQASKEQRLAAVRAEGARAMGEAKAAAEAAHVAAYREAGDFVVIGLALKDLAANLPQIQSLILTPDLLAPLLSKLAASSAQPAQPQSAGRK